jgi:hypothetical protein
MQPAMRPHSTKRSAPLAMDQMVQAKYLWVRSSTLRDLHSAEVRTQSDSDLSHAIAGIKEEVPVFGKTLSEDQTNYWLPTSAKLPKSSGLEKRSWQPVSGG